MQDSKIIKRIISISSFFIFAIMICFFMGRALKPVAFSDYYNHDIKKIINGKEEVELVIVGDSKVYSSMDTRILEEKLGYKNVLLASTSSQTIDGSYYLIKDLIERIHPKKIILAVEYSTLYEEIRTQGSLLVVDCLSLKNKISMFRNCYFDKGLLFALDIYRYRDNLDNILDIYKDRQKLIVNNYVDDHNNDIYYDYKGFIHRDGSIKTGNMPMYFRDKFDKTMFDDYNTEYFYKCIEICKENGIELELIDFPTTVMRMYNVEDFKDSIEYYKQVAKENNIVFHSLNYLKDREAFLPDEMMLDYIHTNWQGAKIVSEIFADILIKENNGEDVSDYFYNNFEEFEASVDRIVSVNGEITNNDDIYHLQLSSLHPKNMIVLYKVEYLNNNGFYQTLIDWTDQAEFNVKLPSDCKGKIMVIAAKDKDDSKYAYQEYNLID